MKPVRLVMSSAHVIAYRLSCGHTVHRKPLSGSSVIPIRIACEHCEAETFRKFDVEQAIARARREAAEERGASGSCDLVELTETDLNELRQQVNRK